MLTLELTPLFRNIVTVPQRDDQRLCQVSRFGLRALPWSVLFRNLIYHDTRTDENRLQHDVWISCPRNIHLPRDELDSDQSVLWFELPGVCTHSLRSPDSLRIANTTHPQDVAEQVISALNTYFPNRMLILRRYRRRWVRHSCLYSVLPRISCCSPS